MFKAHEFLTLVEVREGGNLFFFVARLVVLDVAYFCLSFLLNYLVSLCVSLFIKACKIERALLWLPHFNLISTTWSISKYETEKLHLMRV
jgi:hypothetical protein